MDTEALLLRIDKLSAIVLTLAALVLALLALLWQVWPVEETPTPGFRSRKVKLEPTCPLHKIPRSKCSPESHADD